MAKMLSVRSHNTESSGFRFKYYLHKYPSDQLRLFDNLIEICEQRITLVSGNLTAIASERGFLHAVLNAIATVVDTVPVSVLR